VAERIRMAAAPITHSRPTPVSRLGYRICGLGANTARDSGIVEMRIMDGVRTLLVVGMPRMGVWITGCTFLDRL
jgi:hypothetical protein